MQRKKTERNPSPGHDLWTDSKGHFNSYKIDFFPQISSVYMYYVYDQKTKFICK